jgi:hypothetical protein
MEELMPKARWTYCQPWRGLFGFIVTFVLVLVITVNCSIDAFLGLLSVWIMSLVPLELVLTLGWGGKYPSAESLAQPWRGIALTIFMFLVGTAICFATLGFCSGGSAHAYTNVIAICCVVLTVVATASFGLWPFQKMSVPARGFLTLIAVYVIVYFGIRLFNFSVLSYPAGVNPSAGPVPFYAAGGPLAAFENLVPKGPIPWETALTCWLWVAFLTFSFVMLGFWPLSKFPKLTKQPAMGIIVFAFSCFGSLLIYRLAIGVLRMEPLHLLYSGVSYAFGLLMILVLFQGWPGRRIRGPVGSFFNIALAIVVAWLGYHGVIAICKWRFGNLSYPFSVFAPATFMLGLNFPLWVAYADLWEFWPLPSAAAAAAATAGSAAG